MFIYPIFWTEAPAKLVGWFDRIWTTGFAYKPDPTMKVLEKALFIVCAGKSMDLSSNSCGWLFDWSQSCVISNVLK